MVNLGTLIDLNQHMEWADAEVWASVLSCEKGRTDPGLRERLCHLHMVQQAFLRMWRGESRETPYPTFDDAHAMMTWAQSYYGEAIAHLEASADRLADPMPLPWASMVERRLGRSPDTTSLGETALQVVFHSTYHRGQVNARLRERGGQPPLVDYIAWVWLGRPVAIWPGR